MKENNWKHIIIIVLFAGFLLLIASWIDVNKVSIKKQAYNIAEINHETKRAILDLIQEVNTLNMRQLELRYEIEKGDYDKALFYIEIPNIHIGNCTDCHYKYKVVE